MSALNRLRLFCILITTICLLQVVDVRAQVYGNIVEYTDFTALDFTFTDGAAYPWYITVDSMGTFASILSDTLYDVDTIPLHFNAHILTNLQGGYLIRYAYPYLNTDTLVVLFQDGLPAYASSFTLYIYQDKFWIVPDIVLPNHSIVPSSISVIRQELKLFRDSMNIQSFGYLEYHFQSSELLTPIYFKGHFKLDY